MHYFPGDKPRFFIHTKTYPRNELQVVSFEVSEHLSQPYEMQVEAVAKRDTTIDFEKIVGFPARLRCLGQEIDRYFHGIVSSIRLLRVEKQQIHYSLTIDPPVVTLTHRHKIRIYQKKTTKQIVTQVLKEGGFEDLKWKLSADYKPRDYCVQYRESDHDFFSRLLEEEGITYHYTHKKDKVVMVLTDDKSAFEVVPKTVPLKFNGNSAIEEEHVNTLESEEALRTGQTILRDYNFKKPKTKVEGKQDGKKTELEHYDYPGEFLDGQLGKRLARMRQQAWESDRRTFQGASNIVRLAPGSTFKLGGSKPSEKHPVKAFNAEYLLTGVVHRGWQPGAVHPSQDFGHGYANDFIVVPASTPYRPARITPRPVAQTTHTAMIVGPKGEEIYTDEYGRVKVQFHWDREGEHDEKSSCWIRVAQNWAGAGWGSWFLPRIGMEVLVTFIEGDPDRPIVTGCVYNGGNVIPTLRGGNYGNLKKDKLSPTGLPSNKTRSLVYRSRSTPDGKGFNEIRIEDKKGKEQLYIHAEKDYDIEVENNRTSLVKKDRIERVGKDQEVHVKKYWENTCTEYYLEASKKVTIRVGRSKITMTPTHIQVESIRITEKAKALFTMVGGLVKIN